MRDVVLVSEQELKRMRAMLERDLSLALPSAEMEMIEVVRDGFIERRELSVDQQVMMTRVLAIRTRRCNAHVAQPEIELQLCRHGRSILEIDKVDLGSGAGRSRTAGALRVRCRCSSS